MSRTVSATITSAIAQSHTRPIYLIRMAWSTELRYATNGADISWNSETWTASGILVSQLDRTGGLLEFPIDDSGPWLSLVLNEGPRERSVKIYEYHTDFTSSPNASDAVEVFSGVMDETIIDKRIRMRVIESAQAKGFPASNIDQPTYTHLLPSGTRITWGDDEVVAE